MQNRTKWYIFFIISVAGIVVGIFIAYVLLCSHRLCLRKTKVVQNSEHQQAYDDINLREMVVETNSIAHDYEPVDTAGNDQNYLGYDDLSAKREPENTYQSLV